MGCAFSWLSKSHISQSHVVPISELRFATVVAALKLCCLRTRKLKEHNGVRRRGFFPSVIDLRRCNTRADAAGSWYSVSSISSDKLVLVPRRTQNGHLSEHVHCAFSSMVPESVLSFLWNDIAKVNDSSHYIFQCDCVNSFCTFTLKNVRQWMCLTCYILSFFSNEGCPWSSEINVNFTHTSNCARMITWWWKNVFWTQDFNESCYGCCSSLKWCHSFVWC